MLESACRQVAAWQADGAIGADFRVAVNLTAADLADPGLPAEVQEVLRHADLDAGCLTLEVTETGLVQDTETALSTLYAVRRLGVHVSIDDFGTGYSSLHYLRQLPIHEIKIDRGFIGQVPDDASSVAIVEAILAMARRLDLDVVAEGVETPEHVAFLKARGCPRMQGYFFACPIPVSEWLERSAHTPDAGVANARR
jgi:EAL domain-containing protein (putative c-di-GMP-specific phosphodiesterase class I)